MLPPKEGPSAQLSGQEYTTLARVHEGDIVAFPSRTRRYWYPARGYAREEFE